MRRPSRGWKVWIGMPCAKHRGDQTYFASLQMLPHLLYRRMSTLPRSSSISSAKTQISSRVWSSGITAKLHKNCERKGNLFGDELEQMDGIIIFIIVVIHRNNITPELCIHHRINCKRSIDRLAPSFASSKTGKPPLYMKLEHIIECRE